MQNETKEPVKELSQEDCLYVDRIIDVANLPDNSILVFKYKEMTDRAMMMLQQISVRYSDLLRAKNITALVLDPEASLKDLSDKDLEEAGLQRKEQSRIILPN